MTSSYGNSFRVTGPLCREFTGPGEFPTQRPVTLSFNVFFDLHLNKRLSKQPWGWWFETPSWSFWRQCNGQWGNKTRKLGNKRMLQAIILSIYHYLEQKSKAWWKFNQNTNIVFQEKWLDYMICHGRLSLFKTGNVLVNLLETKRKPCTVCARFRSETIWYCYYMYTIPVSRYMSHVTIHISMHIICVGQRWQPGSFQV